MLSMLMTLWLTLSDKSVRRALPRRRPAFRRPVLEALEDRALPSILMVMNANDKGPGSLRDAITGAKSGDTIEFAPSLDGQTITLTSDQLTINNSLDIEGPGASLLTISGNNKNRIFNINEGLNVTIDGLTLTQGRAVGGEGTATTSSGGGGAILNAGSVLGLANDVFSDNVSLGASGNGPNGGAIANFKTGSLTVSNSTFLNNRADASVKGGSWALGGAIYSDRDASSITLTGCTFTGNQAIGENGGVLPSGSFTLGSANGGAIAIPGPPVQEPVLTLTVIDSTFTGNEAIAGSGGSGPQVNNPGGYLIDTSSGGAIAFTCGPLGTLVVSGSTFTDNAAIGGSNASGASTNFANLGEGGGGAIYAQGVTTITDSSFAGNVALGGNGNSYAGSGTARVGGGEGGAINKDDLHNGVVSWSVSNCRFTNNQAIGGADNAGGTSPGDGFGGAILSIHFGSGAVTGTVSGSTFSGNQAIGGAGSAGSNGADGLGGAVANLQGATLTVSNCTLSGNQAVGGVGGSGANGGNGYGGGLYNDGSSTLTVTGSTVTANSAIGGVAGSGGSAGQGIGGGAYFAAGGTVCLDAFAVGNIAGNMASTSNNDVFGAFTMC
jgi:hypothetical protein